MKIDLHRMSTSMYEVFNWGHVNETRPKRLSLFAGASEINIDDPPPSSSSRPSAAKCTNRSLRATGELFTNTNIASQHICSNIFFFSNYFVPFFLLHLFAALSYILIYIYIRLVRQNDDNFSVVVGWIFLLVVSVTIVEFVRFFFDRK